MWHPPRAFEASKDIPLQPQCTPRYRIFLLPTSCHVMTDIHYWFAAAPPASTLSFLFFFLFFRKSFGKSEFSLCSSRLPLFVVLHTVRNVRNVQVQKKTILASKCDVIPYVRGFEVSKNIPRRPHYTPRHRIFHLLTSYHVMADILYWSAATPPSPTLSFLYSPPPIFFLRIHSESPKFSLGSSGLPLFGVLHTRSKCSKRAGSEENDFGFPRDVIP
ncbi:hypothetical protein CEXT_48171 [Caerostris extrusa]|uniref:Uncharacterized protein n=1 Tax=Caerostris extrusa TaxID=172846 RepID=A0AAV4VGR1_CAEEX|nr:hypothetical protein CEXT_48171 [Caerostris extrusa]